ncbi:AAA family ATPase [Candidatus Woesearchaeota archaeon]|nr:AAA family ATPase [Candidatus Woesearchaeota archaeon]
MSGAGNTLENIDGKIESFLNRTLWLSFSAGKGGTGKTTVSAAVAFVLAEAGLKTLLIDGDNAFPCVPRILNVNDREENEIILENLELRGYGDAMALDFKDKSLESKEWIESFDAGRLVRQFTEVGEFNREDGERLIGNLDNALKAQFGGQLKTVDLSKVSLEQKIKLSNQLTEEYRPALYSLRYYLKGRNFEKLDLLFSGAALSESSERGARKTEKRFYLDNFKLLKEQLEKQQYDAVILDNPAGLPPYAIDAMHVTNKIIVTNPQPVAYEASKELLEAFKKRTLFYSTLSLNLSQTLKSMIRKEIQLDPEEAKRSLKLMYSGSEGMSFELFSHVDGLIEEGSRQSLEKALVKIPFRIESEEDLTPFYNSIRADTKGTKEERIDKVISVYQGYIREQRGLLSLQKESISKHKGDLNYDQADVKILEYRARKRAAHISRVGLIAKVIGERAIRDVLEKMEEGIHNGCHTYLVLNKNVGNEDKTRALGENLAAEWTAETGINVDYVGGLTSNSGVMNAGKHFYLALPENNPSVVEAKELTSRILESVSGISLEQIKNYIDRRNQK